jgi:hypothetical protein
MNPMLVVLIPLADTPIPPYPGSPPPLGIWGGANEPWPTPPIHLPGVPGRPPGIWGGANEPWPTPPIHLPPTGGVPGQPPRPTHPIFYPPSPSHPIFYPPGTGPGQPPVTPPGGSTPPPGGSVGQLPAQDPTAGGWVYAFVPGYGWMWINVASSSGGAAPPVTPPPTEPPTEAPPPQSP